MTKIKIDKKYSMMVSLFSLFILLFSFAILSCDNPFIIAIVEPKTASFESNGGSSVESQMVFKGQPVRKPSNPSRSGFTFDAWYSDNETFLEEWDFSVIPNRDITLYAKWNPGGGAFTVTFDKNGGDTDAIPASRTVESGSRVTPPDTDPTREYFDFTGWYKEADCINIWDFDTDTVTANITLYAKWETIPGIDYFTVTFNSNGGDTEASPLTRTVVSGSHVTAPEPPTKIGYTFGGWYKETTLTTPWNFSADTVSADITLYAKWETIPSLSIEMVHVPGGSFQMGGDGQSTGDGTDSIPVHTVTLTGFYIGKYEVTQAQWQAVMGTTIEQLQTAASSGSTDYGRGNNYPVYWVSWYDALEFCNALSVLEGLTPFYTIDKTTSDPNNTSPSDTVKWQVTTNTTATGYRLPTEAQWEYAAKGGNGTPGNYTYAGSNTVGDVAWHIGNNGTSGTPTYGSKAVGTKTANGLGLYDMSGNVIEWCWDWYGSYSSEAQTDPTGASSGSNRVIRGGGWGNSAQAVRSAFRYGSTLRSGDQGFRILRPSADLPPAPPTWTAVADSTFGTSYIRSIAYGNNRFVAVGDSGKMAYSTDNGVTWTAVTNSPFNNTATINAIAYGSVGNAVNMWVAVGAMGGNGIMAYSTDGVTWQAVTNSTFISSITRIAYGNNRFVAGGYDGKMAYSSDGITWTAVTDSTFGSSSITEITYGNGTFVAGGQINKMAYSTDNGITWTAVMDSTLGSSSNINAIAYGNDGNAVNRFVIGGFQGKMAYSPDGITWAAVADSTFGTTVTIYEIAYANNRFVAVGGSAVVAGDGKMAYSPDGINWTAVADSTFGMSEFRGIAYGGGRFVAGGYGGKIAYCDW